MSCRRIGRLDFATTIALIAALSLLAQPVAASKHAVNIASVPGLPTGIDKWHAPPIINGGSVPELNVKILNFAVEHLGKKVGNGECWTLAADALAASGAQPPADYVFGRELARNEPWLPGDIIQFTSCRFVEASEHKRTTCNIGSPNHTAIVHSVTNRIVVIIQQNVNGDRHAQTQTLNFDKMVSGSLKIYRPLPAVAGGRTQFQSQETPGQSEWQRPQEKSPELSGHSHRKKHKDDAESTEK